MKGDFSRVRFDAGKHYTRVLRQQGRVDLDADHNEESAILEHLQRVRDTDVLGSAAAPHQSAGFGISSGTDLESGDLAVSAGHLYVDGLWCEAGPDCRYLDQPFLPEPPDLDPVAGRTDLVYLDVWQRHVTALEDGGLREPALGGPDTTTRVQTVWQVRVLTGLAEDATCAGLGDWEPPESRARLTVGATTVPLPDDPCLVAPGSGYRGVENHLYRVEVHKAGGRGAARFKWSRDNASMAFAVKQLKEDEPDKVYLNELGKDRVSLLRAGDWVEVLDDHTELLQEGGVMAKVEYVDESQGYVRLDRDIPTGRFTTAHAARLRRWDQTADVDENGLLKPSQTPLELEAGVVVELTGDNFRVGDHWMFSARTGRTGVERLDKADPHGIRHHYAKLALVTWEDTEGGLSPTVHDCRSLFPALTDLTSLFYVGGDGQEVMPDPTQPGALLPLPRPLEVGVGNGAWPVEGARVRFEVLSGGGVLTGTDDDGYALTESDGVASVGWSLGSTALTQHVVATLVDDAGGGHHLPVHFSAGLSIASNVAYDPGSCPTLQGAVTVQDALDTMRSAARLYRMSGDGQQAMSGHVVPSPLEVLVADDCGPVAGAKVTWSVLSGGGSLSGIVATTGDDGLARCVWKLGATGPQQVRVRLDQAGDRPRVDPEELRFDAGLSVASDVAYDAAAAEGLAGAETVQDAIDRLSRRVGGGACTVTARPGDDLQAAVESLPASGGRLCLVAGVHELGSALRVTGRSRVEIVGSGPATVLRGRHEVTLLVQDCSAVEIRSLRVESGGMGTAPGEEHLMGAVTVRGCADVAVVDTQMSCRGSLNGRGQACLTVHGTLDGAPERTRIERNRLEVGANQVGILVVGPRIVEIQDNHLVPALPEGTGMRLDEIGRDPARSRLASTRHVAATSGLRLLPFQQGIVVGGGAGLVDIVGNTVEQAVQGIHVGSWSDRERPITSVVLDRNTVVNEVPRDYSLERHAVYVSGAESTTITNTTAFCSPPRTDSGTEIDAVRVVGDIGPFLRVTGVDVSGYNVGVRVAPTTDPGEGGMDENMWYVGEVLARNAETAAQLSPAVRTGILVTR